MSNDWVKRLMVKWGEAVFNASRGACGANSSYPAYQLVHIRGTCVVAAPDSADAMRIDAVMVRIKASHPNLYHVGVDVYVQCLSIPTTAGRQHCHRDTVYSRLEALHRMVANCLADKSEKARQTKQDYIHSAH
jgi:hypothetical protein